VTYRKRGRPGTTSNSSNFPAAATWISSTRTARRMPHFAAGWRMRANAATVGDYRVGGLLRAKSLSGYNPDLQLAVRKAVGDVTPIYGPRIASHQRRSGLRDLRLLIFDRRIAMKRTWTII